VPSSSSTVHVTSTSYAIVAVSLPTAQHLFGLGENINLVRLVLEEDADARTTREAVAATLPPGLCLREPAARADITRGLRAAASCGLTGLTAVALAAASYIVFGLAQLNLLARRREFAILRTLGASTRQVEGILLRHALLLGGCGGITGTFCGALLSWAILSGAHTAQGLALAPPLFRCESLAVGLPLGIAVSLFAIWLPARSVCRTPPLVLFGAESGQVALLGRRFAAMPVALFCMAVGLWVLGDCAAGRFSQAAGRVLFPPALAFLLVGLAGIVAPRLPGMLAYLERPAQVVFGVEGRLAIRLLGRRPDRSTRACGVCFITTTMVIGFGHTVLNTLAEVRTWTERAIPADLLVHGAPLDPGFVLNVPLPESLGNELRLLDGVASVDRIAFIPTAVNGTPTLVLARTFAPEQPLPLALRRHEADSIRQGLARGEAVLAESLANTLRVRVGDLVTLDTPQGPRQIRVAGVVIEFAAGGAALYLDWNTAASWFGPLGVHVFLVTASKEHKAEASVTRFCAERGLFLQRNRELRTTVDDLTRGLTAGLWGLLAVMIVIATLGVTNTIAALAVEQQNEVRSLRMVGMPVARVRRLFQVQAAVLALVGVPFAIPCGIAVALALDRAIHGLWGYSIPFQVQWTFLLWVVTNAILVGFLTTVASRWNSHGGEGF
jgi:putative ABC transport system permease protein